MAYAEEYYILLQGKQKGPYTFGELKRLYDRGLLPNETPYWQEGLEHTLMVGDLCEIPVRQKRQQTRDTQMLVVVALLISSICLLYFAPLLIVGWREWNQHQYTAESAYWKARGIARVEVKKRKQAISFDRFDPARVTLSQDVNAAVALPGTMFSTKRDGVRVEWRVALRFFPNRKEWRLVALQELPGAPAAAAGKPQ